MRQFSPFGGLLVILLALVSHAQTSAYRFAGVELPPPLPAQNVQDVHWGTQVDDPYRFLEQVKDPAVVS